jgi:hypothetical protein
MATRLLASMRNDLALVYWRIMASVTTEKARKKRKGD